MGITYNIENEKFTIDFEHDGVDDIINLTGKGYQVKAFGQCFHYAYEFADDVQGSVRSAFIKYLKFPPTSLRQQPDMSGRYQKRHRLMIKTKDFWHLYIIIMYWWSMT